MSSTRMPCWATKVVDSTTRDEEFQTSTQQSASLVRIECARTWQQRIYRAQRHAWSHTVKSMMKPEVSKPKEVVVGSELQSALIDYFTVEPSSPPPNEDDDECLPITIVSPPPSCRLDRQALTEALWDFYFRGSTTMTTTTTTGPNGRCCSLWLPRLLPTLHATLHLLARQCVHLPEHNHDDNRQFQRQALRYYEKHQSKRTASMQHILLWWAARTTTYDSMVIILEDPGGFADCRVRNAFVMTVQEWRREYGLPVHLVIVGNVPSSMPMGVARVRYRQPSRIKWLKVFWKELLDHPQTPFPLASKDTLSQLVQNYRLEHGSLSKLCEDLKSNITAFYTHPSKLVWDAVELHPSFLAWFGVHGTAKQWLSMASGASKYAALEECHTIQHQLQWWWTCQIEILPLLMDTGKTDLKSLLLSLADLYQAMKKSVDKDTPSLPVDLERYWDRAGKRKKADKASPATALSVKQQQAQSLLYELILVLGCALSSKDDPTVPVVTVTPTEETEGIHRMLQELFEFCVEAMGELCNQWNMKNPLSKTSNQPPPAPTLTHGPGDCYHRQTLVEGLTSPAKELYGLLQDRLSIPREEWLYHFGGSPQDFMRGVWMLVLAGLVQSKSRRGGSKGIIVHYEKVSVMWC